VIFMNNERTACVICSAQDPRKMIIFYLREDIYPNLETNVDTIIKIRGFGLNLSQKENTFSMIHRSKVMDIKDNPSLWLDESNLTNVISRSVSSKHPIPYCVKEESNSSRVIIRGYIDEERKVQKEFIFDVNSGYKFETYPITNGEEPFKIMNYIIPKMCLFSFQVEFKFKNMRWELDPSIYYPIYGPAWAYKEILSLVNDVADKERKAEYLSRFKHFELNSIEPITQDVVFIQDHHVAYTQEQGESYMVEMDSVCAVDKKLYTFRYYCPARKDFRIIIRQLPVRALQTGLYLPGDLEKPDPQIIKKPLPNFEKAKNLG